MADLIKTFTYTAQDSQEVIQTGEYSAIDQNSVVTYLAGMDLIPINIAEKKKSLLEGLDDMALSLEKSKKIDSFETEIRNKKPWIFSD